MNKLSVVINTLNEEKNLSSALDSIKGLAEEIIIVDMNSDDKTREIARRFKAKVYLHPRTNYVEPARNFAISKAKYEWILIVDADETIPPRLRKEISRILSNPSGDYYRIPRRNIVFGKWIKNSRWWPDYNIRLFKKGSVSWNEVIHSVPLTQGTGLDMPPKKVLAIRHNHYESIEQFIIRLNRYTTEHSKILIKDGYKLDWTDLIKKPASEFLSRYFFGQGYKDGIHGLVLAGLQAFSEFTLYLKIWQSEKFEEKDVKLNSVVEVFKSKEKDFHYWEADAMVNNYGGLINRIKRKFKLH